MVNHAPSQQTAFNLEASRGDEFSPRAERALKLAAKDARTFVSACRDVLTPMRVFTMLAHGTENFAVSAMSTFLPQIVQEQFGLSAGFTSMVFGGSIVLGATTGIVAGGWFVRWRGYGGVETARFCLVAALLAVPLSFCFLAMGCPGDGVLATSSADDFDGLVSLAEGRCEEPVSCGSRLVLFFVLFFFLMFTTFLNNVSLPAAQPKRRGPCQGKLNSILTFPPPPTSGPRNPGDPAVHGAQGETLGGGPELRDLQADGRTPGSTHLRSGTRQAVPSLLVRDLHGRRMPADRSQKSEVFVYDRGGILQGRQLDISAPGLATVQEALLLVRGACTCFLFTAGKQICILHLDDPFLPTSCSTQTPSPSRSKYVFSLPLPFTST